MTERNLTKPFKNDNEIISELKDLMDRLSISKTKYKGCLMLTIGNYLKGLKIK